MVKTRIDEIKERLIAFDATVTNDLDYPTYKIFKEYISDINWLLKELEISKKVIDELGKIARQGLGEMSRLEDIKERLSKATKGEWFNPKDGDSVQAYVERDDYANSYQICLVDREEDLEFIAHSKADVEWLIESLEATSKALVEFRDGSKLLAKENGIMKEALEFYSDSYNMYGEVKECDLKADTSGDVVREFGSLAREALKKVEENV